MPETHLTEAEKRAIAEAVEAESAEFYSVEDGGEDEISAADALIDEIRGEEETTVNVYRIGSGRGKETFLFSASPEDITAKDIMERCRDQYGGGDFKMVTRDAKKIVRSARFSVEAVAAPEKEEKREEFGAGAMIAMIQQSNQQMMGMFQTTMAAMAEAMRGGNQPAFNPTEATRTIMESVAAIKQLADPPQNNNGSEMVKMLIQGITLAKEMGTKDGDTNSYDLLGKALDYLPALAAGAQALPGYKPPGAAPGHNPGAPPMPHPDPETQASIEREHREAMEREQEKRAWEMNVAMLLGWAKTGKDPLLYAELVIDNAPEDRLLAFVNAPDAMEKLIAINPEVANYRPWFETLKNEILALTEPDDSPDTDHTDEPLTGEIAENAVSGEPGEGDTSSAPRGNGGNPGNA